MSARCLGKAKVGAGAHQHGSGVIPDRPAASLLPA
jgi:hypothetical protein